MCGFYCILNYIAHLLILGSTVICCVSISEFSLLVCASDTTASSAVRIKICAVTTGISQL